MPNDGDVTLTASSTFSWATKTSTAIGPWFKLNRDVTFSRFHADAIGTAQNLILDLNGFNLYLELPDPRPAGDWGTTGRPWDPNNPEIWRELMVVNSGVTPRVGGTHGHWVAVVGTGTYWVPQFYRLVSLAPFEYWDGWGFAP